MVAFAGNSVLCRLALGRGLIDPISFSSIRLGGGALALGVIVLLSRGRAAIGRGQLRSALALVLYAIPFSLAYTTLDTGLGALVLFAAVQISMLALAFAVGERLTRLQIVGFLVAMGGLMYLCWPIGAAAPDLLGVGLMAVAGVGWGVYSVLGRRSNEPLVDTAGNFLIAVPFAILATLATLSSQYATIAGGGLALISGVVTSGIGYAIWYAAVRRMTTTTAAAVQLSVPVIAAFGGVLLLSEALTLRLVLASTVILGGIGVSLLGQGHRSLGVTLETPQGG